MQQSICIALFLGMSVSSFVHQVKAQDLVLDSSVLPELARMQAEIDALKVNATAPVANVNSICCEPETKKPDYPSVRLTGFFQADSVYFSQDDANLATVGDVQDGADFRRARLAAVGKAWDNVAYQLEMDFAFPGHPSFMDVWLDIENVVGQSHVRIGQFRQPFGMNGQTSVKELPFLERALPFALLPFRQIGAMWYGTGPDELMTYAVSGYRYPTDVYGGSVGDNGGYGLSTRLTGLLVNGDAGVLHAGGGYSFLDPSSDLFQFRNQPEVFVGETGGGVPAGVPTNVPPFIDTGLIPANNANLLNAELALSYRSVYAQSEVFYTRIDQRGGPPVTLPGAYLQGGWILTGEQRVYNEKSGVFGGVTPRCSVGRQGGIGAWEVTARYSYLDLNDTIGVGPGGRLNNLTAGLNWYLNPNTKFQFSYIHAMLDRTDRVNVIDSDADIFAMRAQVQF